jgi:tetratricopeptide (TPR) repeat protein
MSKIGSSSKIQRLLKESSLLCHSGKFNEAKETYQALLKTIPNHPEVLGNLGTVELQGGNTDLGISYLTRALKSNPTEIKFIINLANAYISINQFKEALEYLESAEKISPNLLNILYNKARALRGLNEFDAAIIYLNKCLTLDLDNYLVLCDLAFLFTQKENFQTAKDLYSKAIKINPENYLTYYNRGSSHEKLNEFQNALEDYNIVIQKNAFFEPALFNKFRILFKQGIYNDALEQINYLINLDNGNLNYISARAGVFLELKDFELAIKDYDHISKLGATSAEADEARTSKSHIKLAINELKEGWDLYESRFQIKNKSFTLIPKLIDFNIRNKRILIWAEQGIGDQIIFSSLLNDALKTENDFIVSIDSRLISLFTRSFSWANNVKFISCYNFFSETQFDFHLPIGSLGKFFRNSIHDFDNHPVAYLKADESKARLLKERIYLENKNHKICGISWKSNNQELGAKKSLSLNQLIPILLEPNRLFINLQYGETKQEIKIISNECNIEIQSIVEIDNFSDIDGLTSLISACDYIVTTSNLTAHIAGALNKKTYLLLPYGSGKIWYWGESSDESLWYPSIEIFRKTRTDSWTDAIEKLSNKLKLDYD